MEKLSDHKLPYALIVAARIRKQAKEMLLEAEALESHYRKNVKPMRDDVFRHSKKYKSQAGHKS